MEIKIIHRNKYFKIIIAILLPLFLGWIVGPIANSNKEPWYSRLQRPVYTPPDIVFPFVWAAIYIMIGYASYRVYEKGYGIEKERERSKFALIFYLVHLFVNITWRISFFYFHCIGFAAIHIIAVFMLLVFTSLFFYRVDKVAGLIFIPYGLWIFFASAVNVAIFKMN